LESDELERKGVWSYLFGLSGPVCSGTGMGELIFLYIVISLYFVIEIDSYLHLRKPDHKCLCREDKEYLERTRNGRN
jgi:hypothetical protein